MREKVTWGIAGGAAAALLAAPLITAPATASSDPVPRFDFSMPDNIGLLLGKVPGANPSVPEYDFTGKYVPEKPLSTVEPSYGATNYGTVPKDGLYEVTLDACASTVGANPVFDWTVAGKRLVTGDCKTTTKLPEGDQAYSLKLSDDGGSTTINGTFTVKNVLIAIMGDSYSSGEGFPPFREGDTNTIAWDDPGCHRSRWSGFVRAATQVEAADPRSSVTVLDVACSGATVTEGIIGPKKPYGPEVPAQVKQLNKLANGQPIDQVYLSIGGNDIGFGDIIQKCITTFSDDQSCFNKMLDPTNTKLEELVKRYKQTADCLNNGDCKIIPQGGGDMVSETPLKVAGKQVIQATYPNLVAGPKDMASLPDVNPGNLCNVKNAGAPLKYGDSYWGNNVVINGIKGKEYQIPFWVGDGIGKPGKPQDPPVFVPFTPTADGIGVQIGSNGGTYGWTIAAEPFVSSTVTPGGLCAYPWLEGGQEVTPAGFEPTRAVYSTSQGSFEGATNLFGIVHPNERGQELYRTSMAPKSIKNAGLPVAAPTVNTNPKLAAPTNLKAKNLSKKNKKHRHVKISFTASVGLKPYAYKVRVKVPGQSAFTIRDSLKKTSTVWKKAPRGKKVKIRAGAFTKSPQQIVWGDWKTLKVKK